jgi:hypothetical protein
LSWIHISLMASRVSPTLTWIGNYVFIYSLRMALIGALLALQVKEPDCEPDYERRNAPFATGIAGQRARLHCAVRHCAVCSFSGSAVLTWPILANCPPLSSDAILKPHVSSTRCTPIVGRSTLRTPSFQTRTEGDLKDSTGWLLVALMDEGDRDCRPPNRVHECFRT